jgi:hypothetical protein
MNDNKHTSKAFVTIGHTSRKYFSRYFGKRVANDDSSKSGPSNSNSIVIFRLSAPKFDIKNGIVLH